MAPPLPEWQSRIHGMSLEGLQRSVPSSMTRKMQGGNSPASPLNTPVWPVQKAGGSWRMAVGYRNLTRC